MIEFGDFNRRSNDYGFTMIVFLNLVSSIMGNSDELIWALSGLKIGFSKRLDEKLEEKAHDGVKRTETRIFDVFVVHLPVILGRNMAVAEVIGTTVDVIY